MGNVVEAYADNPSITEKPVEETIVVPEPISAASEIRRLEETFGGTRERLPVQSPWKPPKYTKQQQQRRKKSGSLSAVSVEDLTDLSTLPLDFFIQHCIRVGVSSEGGKYELIGRLLPILGDSFTKEKFTNIREANVRKMCNGAGLISTFSTKDELVDTLIMYCLSDDGDALRYRLSQSFKETEQLPPVQFPLESQNGTDSHMADEGRVPVIETFKIDVDGTPGSMKRKRSDEGLDFSKRQRLVDPDSLGSESESSRLRVTIEDTPHILDPVVTHDKSLCWTQEGTQFVNIEGQNVEIIWEIAARVKNQ